MTRKNFLKGLLGVAAGAPFAAAYVGEGDGGGAGSASAAAGPGVPKLNKPKKEWKKVLPENAYDVLFEEDTERPWSSPLNNEHGKGTFICAACYLPLFEAAKKFDSGTGWPSFWAPMEGHVAFKKDFKLILPRTEYHCARCGGHQGHVFDDGPPPTGKRYCNNGLALAFVPAGEALPPLRS